MYCRIKALGKFSFWALDDFRRWVKNTISNIRNLRTTFREPGDLIWRGRAYEILMAEKISLSALPKELDDQSAKQRLNVVRGKNEGE